MHRFFVQSDHISGDTARITGEDVKHISKVLRLGHGDQAVLCDGCGMDYLVKISSISKDEVEFHIMSAVPTFSEPECRVTLYQGLPKAGKMELVIQKCVELGIDSIVPVAAERSVVKVSRKDFEAKLARYQRIATEASKQAGRGRIPQVNGLTNYYNADMSRHDLIIIAYEEERQDTLKGLIRGSGARDIALIIGPEGGLEQAEVDSLKEKGGKTVTLGPRILRTETAGMAALAMILYELEG